MIKALTKDHIKIQRLRVPEGTQEIIQIADYISGDSLNIYPEEAEFIVASLEEILTDIISSSNPPPDML